MTTPQRGLGKGLGALIPQGSVFTGGRTIVNIDINNIVANPRQPRHYFDEKMLDDLAESIKAHGLAQPVLCRMREGRYELVAGERRLRASKKAGLSVIPAIIKEFTDQESLELAIIENLQREDLNPMEEAEAYKRLKDEFNLTQEQIAQKVGKNRSTIANSMRLLDLPEEIRHAIRASAITVGHARPLLKLGDSDKQKEFFEEIIKKNLNVRDVEFLIMGGSKTSPEKNPTKRKKLQKNLSLMPIIELLTGVLATRVKIFGSENRGKIEIDYFSKEDLERILEVITGKRTI
jgi:ParB family chromosome partitioning protein